MAQVTIYVEPEIEAKMKAAAKAAGMSCSKWVAAIIRDKTQADWPASVAALAGAWRDLPQAGVLRAGVAVDLPREPI